MECKFYKGLLYRFIPPAILFAWWKLATVLWDELNCQGRLKSTFTCFYAGYDVTFFVGFGSFWGYILWFPVLLISIVMAGLYIQKYLLEHDHVLLTYTYKDALELSWKALFIWSALIIISVCFCLIAIYPNFPVGFRDWALLTAKCSLLVPVWLFFNAVKFR